MPDDVAAAAIRRPAQTVIRYAVGIVIGLAVLAVLVGKRSDLAAAAHQLGSADPVWVLAAIGAEASSLGLFTVLQRRVLRLGGAAVPLPALGALSLANNAIALTVPGEPAVSSAYRFRFYQRYGAAGAVAGWTIFTILVAQAIGMALILLLGVAVALAGSTSAGGAGVTGAGLVIVAAALVILIRRDLVIGLATALVRALRRLTGHPRDAAAARIERTLQRMREISLRRRDVVTIVAGATVVWACDCLCLVCSFPAVHARVPWHSVLLAYGVAQVVGSFPVVPGGLGLVEGSLAVVLVAYGTGRVPAVSAALAFRVVSFWLAIAVGWLTVALIGWHGRRARRGEPAGEWPAGSPPG